MNDRARPMAAEDRRLTLVEAAVELIRTTGRPPTTKAVAEAAGVAEGTVFRAFPTKEALIDAVVGAVVCPVPFQRRVDAIDPALPLRERLIEGTSLLMQRFAEMSTVLAPLGMHGRPVHHDHPGCPDPGADVPGPGHGSSLTPLVASDADRLRVEIPDVVQAVRMLAFAGSHRHLAGGRLTRPADIVDLLLDGALRRDIGQGSPTC